MKITPARSASGGGKIVKIGLVRQPLIMILIVGFMKREELIKLGKIVRAKRTKKYLTQRELAILAKVDRNYIGMLERGERNPSYLSLLKIASGLNMSIEELLTL